MSGSPKNSKKSFLFFSMLFLTSGFFAQRIISLNLFPTNSSVVIKFTISAGPSCSGYTILHGLDSLSYSEIATDPGICGLTTSNEEKSFTHLSPVFNQLNYYKVRLEPYVETSSSKSVFVSAAGKVEMLAFPNPFHSVDDLLSLKIFNTNSDKFAGYIYNQFGKPVKVLDFTAAGDLGTISLAGLDNGLYVIWLTNGSKAFRCKLIVLR